MQFWKIIPFLQDTHKQLSLITKLFSNFKGKYFPCLLRSAKRKTDIYIPNRENFSTLGRFTLRFPPGIWSNYFSAPSVIHLSFLYLHPSPDSGCEIFNVSLFRQIFSSTLLFLNLSPPQELLFSLQVFLLLTRPLQTVRGLFFCNPLRIIGKIIILYLLVKRKIISVINIKELQN